MLKIKIKIEIDFLFGFLQPSLTRPLFMLPFIGPLASQTVFASHFLFGFHPPSTFRALARADQHQGLLIHIRSEESLGQL